MVVLRRDGWRSGSLVLVVLAAWVLALPTAAAEPRPSARLGPPVRTAVDGPSDESLSVAFACPSGAVTVLVDGAATPSPAPDGGEVDLTLHLGTALTPTVTEADELRLGQPLPAAIVEVTGVTFADSQGLAETGWSATEGRLTLILEPERDGPPADLSVTVLVSVRLATGLAPGPVQITTPDTLTMEPARGGDGGAPSCPAAGTGSTLISLPVTATSDQPDPPPAPDPPSQPDPPASPLPSGFDDPAPDRAAEGDAPTPPPLAPEEIPYVPAPPDPGAASQVVTDDADRAQSVLDEARNELAAADRRVGTLDGRAERLSAEEDALEVERLRLADEIDRAREDLWRRAGAVYVMTVNGRLDRRDVTRAAWARAALLESVAECRRLEERQAEVLEELGGAAVDRALQQVDVDRAAADRQALRARVSDGEAALDSVRSGAAVAVTGFQFPVGGTHSFTDTWQAPRAGGRQHQGTDIFADEGTPLRAVERGALARVGQDVLGGTKLWLVGESGTHYYYAHLSAYAAGVAEGTVVAAGETIGYVGNTGDARTTPPHLHFEVHPDGGSAVDGYPMLVAADRPASDDRPVGGGSPAPTEDDPVATDAGPEDDPAATDAGPEPGSGRDPNGDAAGDDANGTTTSGSDPVAEADGGADPDGAGGSVERPADRTGDIGSDVALDGRGNRYVVDAGTAEVRWLDPDGEVRAEWGGEGSRRGSFREPTGVAVGPGGAVYVADAGNNRIQKFTRRGRFIAAWGSTGAGPGRFNHPTDVAVSGDGTVYVTDTYNNRVQAFDPAGEHLVSWGALGTGDGDLAHPQGVTVGPDGDVFVADAYNGRVQRFTASGRFVGELGAGVTDSGDALRPVAVVATDDGALWVLDRTDDRVRRYDRDGQLVEVWTEDELATATPDEVPVTLSAQFGG